jgi:hypothetical protein
MNKFSLFTYRAHIIWRKDDEELRKSRKHKINKKGALKIVDINFSDSGIYSCWGKYKLCIISFLKIQCLIIPKNRV